MNPISHNQSTQNELLPNNNSENSLNISANNLNNQTNSAFASSNISHESLLISEYTAENTNYPL